MSTKTIDPRPLFPAHWSALDITPDELSLAHTLPVGQTFLWHRHPLPVLRGVVKSEDEAEEVREEWSRAIPDPPRVILLRQSSTKVYYTSIPTPGPSTEAADKTYLLDLFNMDTTAPYGSLEDIYNHWAALDPALFGKALAAGAAPRGVRVLRQDPWECLIAFITSSANNVPRITSLLHRLCTHFSPPLMTLPAPGHGHGDTEPTPYTTYHLFPRPADLLRPGEARGTLETTLRELGFGYRAGFISSSLETLINAHGSTEERGLLGLVGEGGGDTRGVEAFLKSLRRGARDFTTPAAAVEGDPERERWRGELLALKGVGRKVADCIGLMSLDRTNVVPIDTHLQQIAARHPRFPGRLKAKSTSTAGVYDAVQGFLRDLWGRRVEGGVLGDGEAEGEGKGEGEGSMEAVPLAGWCQSVMFAADLKGSTAVVRVKIEVEVSEDVDVDGGGGGAVVGKRSRSSVGVKRTASVVSEGLRSQGTGIDVEPDVGTDPPPLGENIMRKRKRELKVEDGVKTRTKTAGREPAVEDGAKTQPRTKAAGRGKAREGGQISAVWTSVKQEVRGGAGGPSGRAERYSARCDKLEVDIATGGVGV